MMIADVDPVIAVMGEEELIEIRFSAVAAYHGQGALAMLAVTFQALRLALRISCPDRAPMRREISILSGHPGPGVRDAFECLTRAVTRGVYHIDRSLPQARLAPGGDLSYSFQITINNKTTDLALRPDVLPARFFALTFTRERTAEEDDELRRLRRSIAAQVLAAPPDQLFDAQLRTSR